MGLTSQMTVNDERILEFTRHIISIQLEGRYLTRNSATGCVEFTRCHFVPYDGVKAYFQDREKISALLKSIYGPDKYVPDVETISSMSLKIFCILLLINRGHLIRHFVTNDIDDARLPFRTLDDDLKHISEGDEDFWSAFNKQQWRFFPHKFKLEQINTKVHDSKIFPIYKVEEIDKGDGRTVHKIFIHGDYHTLRPRITGLSQQQEEDQNTFVLKSLDGTDAENLQRYESEVNALHRLGCNGMPGARRPPPAEIVRCFGSFKHSSIYHIILEYADVGTLFDYLSNTPAPRNRHDLIEFWESLKALAIGLAKIHNVLSEEEDSIGVFRGYHQDLNLANILVFKTDPASNYRITFKIADLGLTNLVKSPHYLLHASGEGKPGTRTFGSPESHQAHYFSNGKFTSGQSNDIWALTCIFSTAATWSVGGWPHVLRYAAYRKEARDISGKTLSDCFHDDTVVLEEVQEWHEILVNDKAPYDNIIPKLWSSLLAAGFASAAMRPPAVKFQIAATGLTKNHHVLPQKSATINVEAGQPTWEDLTHPRQLQRVRTDGISGNRPWSRHERETIRSEAELSRISDEDLGQSFVNRPDTTSQSPISIEHTSNFPYEDVEHDVTERHHQNNTRPSTSFSQPSFQAPYDEDVPRPSTSFSRPSGQERKRKSHPSVSKDKLRSSKQSSNLNSSEDLFHFSRLTVDKDSQPSSSGTSHSTQPSESSKGKQKAIPDEHAVACPAHPSNKQPMDYMSVQDLLAWKEARDRRRWLESRDSFDNVIPHSSLKENLKDRDHVFLFENSESMKPHWKEMYILFGAMAKFIKSCDKDGMEVYFTVGQQHLKRSDSKPLVDMVMAAGNKLDASSSPEKSLRTIWNRYKDGVRHGKRQSLGGKKQTVGLTIYIFTDGKWQQGTNLVVFLKDVTDFLEKHDCDKDRVGIQFIQFGKGKRETAILEALDKNLRKELCRDIVDRESSDGNVWKMLLGSVLPGFDDDDEDLCNCSYLQS